MENKDKEQRLAEARAAARTLRANMGDRDASEELLEFAYDGDWEVRKAVAEAMAYANPGTLPRFHMLADDSNA